MSSDEQNESHGPKKGIKITKDQADALVKRHFPQVTVAEISHINRGYNNRVYVVTTSSNQEFILRLSGRFWNRYKTENEVAGLLYINKLFSEYIPVPRVFGYCTDKLITEANAEYILMEKAIGEPLENVWDEFSIEDKKTIIDQVAKIYSKLQSTRFTQIGSFQLCSGLREDSLGDDWDESVSDYHKIMRIGKGVEFDGGPFETYLEYFKSSCETEIEHLETCDFMKESNGYQTRLERIKTFVAAFGHIDTVPNGIQKEFVENVPFVLTHGDIEPRNIMVNKENVKITCLLDWEFAGSYPIDEEWFTGFRFVNADTSDCCVFDEMEGVDTKTVPERDGLLREYFINEMRKQGVLVPDDLPGHTTRSELYYFKGFICPWWLREKLDHIPDTHYSERENACKKVDLILEKYGF